MWSATLLNIDIASSQSPFSISPQEREQWGLPCMSVVTADDLSVLVITLCTCTASGLCALGSYGFVFVMSSSGSMHAMINQFDHTVKVKGPLMHAKPPDCGWE